MKESTILLHLLVTTNFMSPYPPQVRNDYVNEYFGVQVSDPYQWLEKLDSYATKKFIKAEKKLTEEFFKSIPERRNLQKALTNLWNYKTFDCPIKKGDRYFFSENSGLQNQSVIYMQQSLQSESEVVLDPNFLSEDGTVSLSEYSFSESGHLIAYVLSHGSSFVIHFKNISSGESFPETLLYSKSPTSLSWTHDDRGVFYTKYPARKDGTGLPSSSSSALNNGQIYYHLLGSRENEDILVSNFPKNAKWSLSTDVSSCGKYLIITAKDFKASSAVFFAPLYDKIEYGFHKSLTQIFHLSDDAEYTYVSNVGTSFLFTTSKNATNNGRLISVDVGQSLELNNNKNLSTIRSISTVESYSITEIISEHPNQVLSWARLVNQEFLILCYVSHVTNILEMVNLKNMSSRSIFPLTSGSISGFTEGDKNDTQFFFLFESFLSPKTVYFCDVITGEFDCEIYRQMTINNKLLNLNSFNVQKIHYKSKDGTSIPMNILHKKDIVMDGRSPALLFGHGAFRVNLLPKFSLATLAFIDIFGGVCAIPNVRGGGEFGDSWHDLGRGLNKQNSFDDFIAAAEYLVNKNYSRPKLLTVKGSGHGGLLVAASVNQRPELFGAAIIQSALLDLLRFQKFAPEFCLEFGCATTDEEYFRYLHSYSPYHNIKMPMNESIQYPSIFVTTVHNDRIAPLHSYKYIAELQHTIGRHERQKNPLLLRVENNGGHVKSTMKEIQETTDIFAFLMESLGVHFQKEIQNAP